MKSIIQNLQELDTSKLRQDALHIAEQGFQALAVEAVFDRELRVSGSQLRIHHQEFDLDAYERIFVIGAGKGLRKLQLQLSESLVDV